MKKYTLLAALAFSALTVTATPKENTSQGNPQAMDKFITELMGTIDVYKRQRERRPCDRRKRQAGVGLIRAQLYLWLQCRILL